MQPHAQRLLLQGYRFGRWILCEEPLFDFIVLGEGNTNLQVDKFLKILLREFGALLAGGLGGGSARAWGVNGTTWTGIPWV